MDRGISANLHKHTEHEEESQYKPARALIQSCRCGSQTTISARSLLPPRAQPHSIRPDPSPPTSRRTLRSSDHGRPPALPTHVHTSTNTPAVNVLQAVSLLSPADTTTIRLPACVPGRSKPNPDDWFPGRLPIGAGALHARRTKHHSPAACPPLGCCWQDARGQAMSGIHSRDFGRKRATTVSASAPAGHVRSLCLHLSTPEPSPPIHSVCTINETPSPPPLVRGLCRHDLIGRMQLMNHQHQPFGSWRAFRQSGARNATRASRSRDTARRFQPRRSRLTSTSRCVP